jgi:hypothetical protein
LKDNTKIARVRKSNASIKYSTDVKNSVDNPIISIRVVNIDNLKPDVLITNSKLCAHG